ncbi:heterokaryon incompatibility protein-domain-containing protein [Echria macrotheca]|uniref:Heterokaryon incompatibility protein-domain-containing protein n=1 Tax=Echria macrotheca TaxID=438768 RepID=A0AAJ0F7R0_9PEZI|nr:heterokaryon incompatibility protein-domain-containing protein [Echria macrotheca]
MWLINTTTLELEDFISADTAPAYAILSHTWGSEEVTFTEYKGWPESLEKKKTFQGKKGFAKIEKTCSLARESGIRYAWVDTCCIDKSSSAELSEAINSMFQWYQRARICYAWIEDWKPGDAWDNLGRLGDEVGSGQGSQRPVPRWFTRGWTLQELIAPQDVVFYDQGWRARGSKLSSAVATQLSRITRISEEVITGEQQAASQSTAIRMSWAAHRHTTRVEDMAYCLFGIFDVNMPLLYGEGDKAFLRLQEEILRSSTDLSILAWDTRDADRRPGLRRAREFDMGPLAPHPRHFARSWDCRTKLSMLAGTEVDEVLVTNKGGLRITTSSVFFIPDTDGYGDYYCLYLGCICCGVTTNRTLRAIRIERITGNEFWRREPVDKGHLHLPSTAVRAKRQTIHLTKRKHWKALPADYSVVEVNHYTITRHSYVLELLENWPESDLSVPGTVPKYYSGWNFGTFPGSVGFMRFSLTMPPTDKEGPATNERVSRFEFLLVHRRKWGQPNVEADLCEGAAAERFMAFAKSGDLLQKSSSVAELALEELRDDLHAVHLMVREISVGGIRLSVEFPYDGREIALKMRDTGAKGQTPGPSRGADHKKINLLASVRSAVSGPKR